MGRNVGGGRSRRIHKRKESDRKSDKRESVWEEHKNSKKERERQKKC